MREISISIDTVLGTVDERGNVVLPVYLEGLNGFILLPFGSHGSVAKAWLAEFQSQSNKES